MESVSVVIPVYNSAESLPEVVSRLAAVLPALASQYETILVNDDSPDRSWEVIRQLTQDYPWVRGINLRRNYGQHNALLCGIRAAQYAVTVTMDDDLQHPPEEIHKLLEKLAEGNDVVYGVPLSGQHGIGRKLASYITKRLFQTVMGVKTARDISAFRAFRTPVRDAFEQYYAPLVSIDVLLTWGSTRFSSVVVTHEKRKYGRSNYTFTRLVSHAMNMLTGFSVLPLELASYLGFAFTLFGILMLVLVIGRYLIEGGSVPGFPFLASVISIFSGVQLFVIGILGKYLARMYLRTMDRPPYTIRDDTASNLPDESH